MEEFKNNVKMDFKYYKWEAKIIFLKQKEVINI